MRGGIPLYPRSARKRKRTKRIGLRILQSGMAVSVLLLYTSNQIGSTYGEFSASQKLDSSITLCTVFPGQIEQLLFEVSDHVTKIAELKASLGSYSMPHFKESPAIGGLSLEELDSAAQNITEQISAANTSINALEGQLSFNAGIWQQILHEASRTAELITQIGGYMINLEPNCLEIRDAQFFQEFQSHVSQSGVLSESLVDTLAGILRYLTSVHEIGSLIAPGDPWEIAGQPNRELFLPQEPIIAFISRAYSPEPNVSTELLSTYEQLNTALDASKSTLSSKLIVLQNQQTQIADTKAIMLEQAQKEEAERLELEKKKQDEAADKANEEAKKAAIEAAKGAIQAPPDPEVIPVEEANPQNSEISKPSNEVQAPESIMPEATPDSSSIPEESLKEEPAQVETPNEPVAQTPSATPVPPSDSDSSKGGD